MIENNEWLKREIVTYLQNNLDKKLSNLDIVSYFKLRVDITRQAIKELQDEGRIIRHNGISGGWSGNHYYTTIQPSPKQP